MTGDGPVIFAYDGSDLAKAAIDEAGRQLGRGRDALILTIWKPVDVGFVPSRKLRINVSCSDDVRVAAEETAAQGAVLADKAGFRAKSAAVQAAPAWKGIVEAAEQHDASLIVLGSHGRSGLADIFVGSVAGAVAARSRRTILITHGVE